MNAHTEGSPPLKVYMTPDGRAVIEQSKDAVVVLTSEQILTVIKELNVCYDYCAAWKQSAPSDAVKQ